MHSSTPKMHSYLTHLKVVAFMHEKSVFVSLVFNNPDMIGVGHWSAPTHLCNEPLNTKPISIEKLIPSFCLQMEVL